MDVALDPASKSAPRGLLFPLYNIISANHLLRASTRDSDDLPAPRDRGGGGNGPAAPNGAKSDTSGPIRWVQQVQTGRGSPDIRPFRDRGVEERFVKGWRGGGGPLAGFPLFAIFIVSTHYSALMQGHFSGRVVRISPLTRK